jgi:hypothetical protein
MGSGWAAEALADLRASRCGRGIVCALGVPAGGRLPVIASVWVAPRSLFATWITPLVAVSASEVIAICRKPLDQRRRRPGQRLARDQRLEPRRTRLLADQQLALAM